MATLKKTYHALFELLNLRYTIVRYTIAEGALLRAISSVELILRKSALRRFLRDLNLRKQCRKASQKHQILTWLIFAYKK